MENLCSQRAADKLNASDMHALDALLEVYPAYAPVDDYRAVTKLLTQDFIEANVRKDGEVDQPVYRITARGAEAYKLRNHVHKLERVG